MQCEAKLNISVGNTKMYLNPGFSQIKYRILFFKNELTSCPHRRSVVSLFQRERITMENEDSEWKKVQKSTIKINSYKTRDMLIYSHM